MEGLGTFSSLPVADPPENFAKTLACAEDPHPDKVDLALGGIIITWIELILGSQ